MKVNIVSKYTEGGEVLVNAKGCEEIDIELADIGSFGTDSSLRFLGLGKDENYKLTTKSWKALKKELAKRGMLNIGSRLNLSRETI